MTGYTIKWTEIKDTYKAVVAMANDEVQMVVANSRNTLPLCFLVESEFVHHSGYWEGV